MKTGRLFRERLRERLRYRNDLNLGDFFFLSTTWGVTYFLNIIFGLKG